MKPSKLLSQVNEHSRGHETALRKAERELAAAQEQLLGLDNDIVHSIGIIASTQLNNSGVIPADVAHVLKRRGEQEAGLREELKSIEQSIGSQYTRASELREKMEAVRADVDSALSSDPAYVALASKAAELSQQASIAQELRDEILAECDKKLAGFVENKCYSYLRGVKFGTPEYKKGWASRYLDGIIAEQVNFKANLDSETTLVAMRETIQNQAKSLASDSSGQASMEAAYRTQRLDEAGYERLVDSYAALSDQLSASKSRANEIHNQLKEFAAGEDTHSRSARQLMSKLLISKTHDELVRLAATTGSEADDTAVMRVDALREKRASQVEDIDYLVGRKNRAAREYEKAKEAERRLRSRLGRDGDSQYRYDSSLDLDALLLGYMAGTLDIGRIESSITSHREVIPTQSYNSRNDDDSGSIFGGSGSIGGGTHKITESFGGGSFEITDSF